MAEEEDKLDLNQNIKLALASAAVADSRGDYDMADSLQYVLRRLAQTQPGTDPMSNMQTQINQLRLWQQQFTQKYRNDMAQIMTQLQSNGGKEGGGWNNYTPMNNSAVETENTEVM